MLRRTCKVVAVALAAGTAAPLAAQDITWSSRRPDAEAPLGVREARTLDAGELEITYRYRQLNSKGIWLQGDSLPLNIALLSYPIVPTSRVDQRHMVTVAYAPTGSLTLMGSFSYTNRERSQVNDQLLLYKTAAREFGDLEVAALYKFVETGGYRGHIQVGVTLPTGPEDAFDNTPSSPSEALPYDMRVGAGVVGFKPGITASAQNERGSVGAQVKGLIYTGTNDLGFRPGNLLDVTGWAAVRLNDYFSLSARVHWLNWGAIQGADPALDSTRDPENDGFFLGGERVDLPLGINFYLPEGSGFLAGNRLSFEAMLPVHQDYEGPQMGLDWGIVAGWTVSF